MTRDYDIGNAATFSGKMSFCEATEALEELGIAVQDAAGNFKSLYEILDGVSEMWKLVASPSANNRLSEAPRCLISSFENASLVAEDDTALSDFLKQFERSDDDAAET